MIFAVIGALILIIAITGSVYLVKRNNSLSEHLVRWVAFALYFWLLVFIQLMIFAAIYSLWKD